MTIRTPARPPGAGLSRRDAMILLAAGVSAGSARGTGLAPTGRLGRKRLLHWRLEGGNDGLNTVVPWRDPLYRASRPQLALAAEELLTLDDDTALHPALRGLAELYAAGELIIVRDVGHDRPSGSHFESAAIWDTASPRSAKRSRSGWWSSVVAANPAAFDAARLHAAAIAFDSGDLFARGGVVPVLFARQDMASVLDGARAPRVRIRADLTPEAREIAEGINCHIDVCQRVVRQLHGRPMPRWEPYIDPLDLQVRLTAWTIDSGIVSPYVRLQQGGYDTHALQLERQATLLAAFDRAAMDLRSRLKALGAWDDTVVMVQSEFGRRVRENHYGGTDHGTSGPVFLFGGKVGGGVQGVAAGLDRLDGDGNLVATSDFRSLYGTLVSQLWQLPADPFAGEGRPPLPLALG